MGNTHCLVCNKNSFTEIYNNTLLKCNNCGFVTANLQLDEDVLKKIYTENYFKGEEYVDYIRDKIILQTNFKKRLQKIFKLTPKTKIKNTLEIGCAYGFFAELIKKELQQQTKYIGYDIVPEAINYAQKKLGQNVFCKDYLKTNTTEKYTDVFMWDVIEHLPNPDKFLEKIYSETSQGGRIYITTGDIGRFIPRTQKANWRMIHPPSHLHYFSKQTLSLLLHQKGYKVIDISYPPVSRSIHLIFYSLFMLRKQPSTFTKKIYDLIPKSWSIPINTFDIMFVIAEKEF